jgi:hypothetical protein
MEIVDRRNQPLLEHVEINGQKRGWGGREDQKGGHTPTARRTALVGLVRPTSQAALLPRRAVSLCRARVLHVRAVTKRFAGDRVESRAGGGRRSTYTRARGPEQRKETTN